MSFFCNWLCVHLVLNFVISHSLLESTRWIALMIPLILVSDHTFPCSMCASSMCKVAPESMPRAPSRAWSPSGSPSDPGRLNGGGAWKWAFLIASWSLPCTPRPSQVAGPEMSVLVPHLCQVSVVSHTLERQMTFIQLLFSFLWKKMSKR